MPAMYRRVGLWGIAALVLSLAGSARAETKPTVAVLGLEVLDDGSGDVDDATVAFAAELTAGLRKRAALGKGAYQLAPNSNKDLLEMKLLSGCSDDDLACMAGIGQGLNASRLLYGKVEKTADGYQVSLNLLNVESRSMERRRTDLVPFDEGSGDDLEGWSRRLYNRITGVPDEGTIRIKANVAKGTVYIDDEPKTTLSSGSAKITGLPEGEYTIAVESEGYTRYAGTVTVTGGETTQVSVVLAREGGGGIGGGDGGGVDRPGGGYRAAFWTSVVLTGAGVAGMTVSGIQVRGAKADKQSEFENLHPQLVAANKDLSAYPRKPNGDFEDVCVIADDFKGEFESAGALADDCSRGRTNATLFNVFLGTSVVTAIAAGYFYYKGYMGPGADASAGSESAVRVRPAVGPNLVGAGIEIEF